MCQSFVLGERGKYSIIDVFDKVIAPNGVPASRVQTAVAICTSGTPGIYTEVVEIVNLNDNTSITKVSDTIEIKADGKNVFVANIVGITFPTYGRYWIKVTIQGQEKPLTNQSVHYVEVREDI